MTRRIAGQAGSGDFYMLNDGGTSQQTQSIGIRLVTPLLRHPANVYRPKNINYGPLVLITWGLVAMLTCSNLFPAYTRRKITSSPHINYA